MALTPEELRLRVPNWSLESDGQLLQYMISIAKNVEDRCSQTRDNLNGLMLQVKQTEVKLANATNQFSAVEQVKFVENRVEEDDESFYGLRRRRQQGEDRANEPRPEDGAERSLDDLIQLAVERSIEGVYASYEKVTLQLTDSESSDEDEPPSTSRLTDPAELSAGKATIMRAIPRYGFIERPLPHVIGSKEWQSKWHVGLIDSDDESSSDRKEEYSESPSETDDGGMFPSQPNSKNHTPSESESSIWGADGIGRKRAPSMDPSVTEDDRSSVYSFASSSKVPRTLPNMVPVAVRGIPPEVARLKPPGLFPEEPPEEDVRRRTDRGLFDDSPDESESMSTPTPQPRQTDTGGDTAKPFFKGINQQPVRKVVNLFDDEPPEPSVGLPEQKKTINLFIESEDEEEAKLNERNNNPTQTSAPERADRHREFETPATRPSLKNPRAMTKLVDELNNNFRKQQQLPVPETTTVQENSARERSQPKEASVANTKRSAGVTNLFDDEPPVDEFDQLFSASNASLKPALRQAGAHPKKTVNLFADDGEEDNDGIVVGSNETRAQPPLTSPGRLALPKPADRSQTVKKKSIFDESESDEDGDGIHSQVFGDAVKAQPAAQVGPMPKPMPKPFTSIFSDSSEAEDNDGAEALLFGKSSNLLKSKLDTLKSTVGRSDASDPPKKLPSKPVQRSLFDDESDEEQIPGADRTLFERPASKPAPLWLEGKDQKRDGFSGPSLFDDQPPSDDEDALFGGPKSSTQPIVVAENQTVSDGDSVNVPVEQPTLNHNQAQTVVDSTSVKSELPGSKHSDPQPEKEPQPAGGSIRSLIMKKSIFNSESESEEDDSVKGPEPVENTTSNPENGTTEASRENSTDEGASAISIEREQKANQQTDVDSSRVAKPSELVDSIVKDEQIPAVERSETSTNASTTEKPVEPLGTKSIFDDSSSEGEEDDDPFGIVKPKSAEKDMNLQANPPETSAEEDIKGHNTFNGVHSESSNSDPRSDEQVIDSAPHSGDKATPKEPQTMGAMIANDIDYYLRTNEPPRNGPETIGGGEYSSKPSPPPPETPPKVKSEPKSALNFSPIGLFDDVPPPDDDEDGSDDVTERTQSPTLDSTESRVPPNADTPDPYSTESQSLDFIPSGVGNGNRSRYLFDDEPPPDETDDGRSSAGFKLDNPTTKGLFDRAPVSLPPMVEDIRKPQPKVNKLNTKLAINVAALLPGARRPPTVVSSPERVKHATSDSPPDSLPTSVSTSSQNSDGAKLTSLNKGRARIPTKRKPPSRQNLRAASGRTPGQDAPNEDKQTPEDLSQSTADDRIVVGSEGTTAHIEEVAVPETAFLPRNLPTPLTKDDPIVDRLSASVRNPLKRTLLPEGHETGTPPVVNSIPKSAPKQTESKSIFGDSDSNGEPDEDDFFSKLPSAGLAVKAAGQEKPKGEVRPKGGLFGSDDDDEADGGEDDLFGGKKSTIVRQLKSTQGRKSLFDDDDGDGDDDDDLFGSKSKSGPQQQPEQRKPISKAVKPVTTTTRTVDDPLADLLADS